MDMPSFRDPETGQVWIWEPTSQTYVKTDGGQQTDRGHASGGDNSLFDPAAGGADGGIDGNLFSPSNPLQEGFMASFEDSLANLPDVTSEDNPNAENVTLPGVVCPNCRTETRDTVCPDCGKDLTPEHNQDQDRRAELGLDQHPPQHDHLGPFPQVVDRPNHNHWDNSFPSMLSHLRIAFGTDEEWMNFLTQGPKRFEIGKWIQDRQGQLHYLNGQGVHHDIIAQRDDLPREHWGAIGSVYNDGTAQTQRIYENHPYNHEALAQQIQQAFGPVELQQPASQQEAQSKGESFEPFTIGGGQWVMPMQTSPLTGLAYVRERPAGAEMSPQMILVAEHLTPDDYALWHQGVRAIVTATGGLGSHAAYLASTEGIPVVLGIGSEYSKIESGNYLKIDPTTQTITVLPAATAGSTPEQKLDTWNAILHHQQGVEQNMQPTPIFSHIDEELAWREANAPKLDSCPEGCGPLMEHDGEKVCHTCGHKQKIMNATVAGIRMAAPALELVPEVAGEVAGGLGEAGAGEAASGAAGGVPGARGGIAAPGPGQGIGQAGHLMQKALQGLDAPQPQADDAGSESQGVVAKAPFGGDDDEQGMATKDRGDDVDPDNAGSSGSGFDKDMGDGDELLKDVTGLGGAGDPEGTDPMKADKHLQDKAMKAFHMNLPLVIEFANSPDSGAGDPIIKALDELLESAFPGYKDGMDQENGATGPEEHPDAQHGDETGENKGESEDKEESDKSSHEASFWHNVVAMDVQTPGPANPAAAAPGAVPVPDASGLCPTCNQAHAPGTPCPVMQPMPGAVPGTVPGAPGVTPTGIAGNQQMTLPGSAVKQHVVTHNKWSMIVTAEEIHEHTEHHDQDQGQPQGDGSQQQPVADPAQAVDWVDDQGQPLQEGQEYEMHTGSSFIPDRITVTKITPEKLVFTLHSGEVDFQDEVTKQDVANEGYTFTPSMGGAPQGGDSVDGFAGEAPVRPGDDSGAQVDDLSQPSTVVSAFDPSDATAWAEQYEKTGSFDGDAPDVRSWLMEGSSSGVDVDPALMAKFAGRDYSPREQREFIEEDGVARNLSKLDLSGTHYPENAVDDAHVTLW